MCVREGGGRWKTSWPMETTQQQQQEFPKCCVCCSVLLICYTHTGEFREKKVVRVWKSLKVSVCVLCVCVEFLFGCCCCCWLEGRPLWEIEREKLVAATVVYTSLVSKVGRRAGVCVTWQVNDFPFVFLYPPRPLGKREKKKQKTWCSTCLKRWPARTKPPITAPKITTNPGNNFFPPSTF